MMLNIHLEELEKVYRVADIDKIEVLVDKIRAICFEDPTTPKGVTDLLLELLPHSGGLIHQLKNPDKILVSISFHSTWSLGSVRLRKTLVGAVIGDRQGRLLECIQSLLNLLKP